MPLTRSDDVPSMTCGFTGRQAPSNAACFEPATARVKLTNGSEQYACTLHTRWLVDSGLALQEDVHPVQ